MVTENCETWYYLHRATTPTNVYEAEDLLNTMPIYSTLGTFGNARTVRRVVGEGGPLQMVPIATRNYVLIVATKIIVSTNGTYTLNVQSSSATDIYLHVRDSNTGSTATSTLSGASNELRTTNVVMTGGREYTIIMIQSNTSMNTTIHIHTVFSGIYYPRNKAYTGGNGVTLKLSSSSVVAVGDYKHSARTADFDGWLLCDGREVFRDAYPALFTIIGTSFGSPSSGLKFKLPDARGRVSGAIGTGTNLTARNLGAAVGTETHTLTTDELPEHAHTGTTSSEGGHNHGGATGTDGSHNHDYYMATDDNNGSNNPGQLPPGDANPNHPSKYSVNTSTAPNHTHAISSDGAHTHTFTTANVGLGRSHNIMQPTVFIGNLFICAEV